MALITAAEKAAILTFLLLISNTCVFSSKVPTLYDVLQLVYQVCCELERCSLWTKYDEYPAGENLDWDDLLAPLIAKRKPRKQATEGETRVRNLDCVSYHMGAEVYDSIHRCMSESNNQSAIDHFCEQLTHVEEWTAKHSNPPEQLTTIMGLAALGRMACVLGDVHRPLPMWQAAFSKCFPDYRHGPVSVKGSSKNRSENILGRDRI